MAGGNPYAAIFAAAKKLGLDKEGIHEVVFRETGKTSLTQLSKSEIVSVAKAINGQHSSPPSNLNQKRTNEGGNPRTRKQRALIYKLTEKLGWNDDNNRINGFVKKMFHVDRIEWLNVAQCAELIEALKAMIARKEA